jgi:hypothetical protein
MIILVNVGFRLVIEVIHSLDIWVLTQSQKLKSYEQNKRTKGIKQTKGINQRRGTKQKKASISNKRT